MKIRNMILTCATAVVVLSVAASASFATTLLPTVQVGDYGSASGGAGNAADVNGYGGANYSYAMGTTEVTNAQYADFLKDVASAPQAGQAAADPYGLYSNLMTFDTHGGIQRSGAGTTVSPYQYAAKQGADNKPVVFVSWYDAVRYCNYLTNKSNGWGLGTETGGYAIANGGKDSGTVTVPTPAQRLQWADPKKADANANDPAYYLLPTESEWYKAAYYKGGNGGAVNAGYWKFPTQSDNPPASQLPPGTNSVPGSANYTTTGTPLDAVKFTTPVGSYVYTASKTAYGTSDQSGNVWEWTETPLNSGSSQKILRGGAYDTTASTLAAYTGRSNGTASSGYTDVGFRIVMVPEPSSLAMLLASAALAFIWWLRRRS